MFWASKFGHKLGQVSSLQTCKNESCYPYLSPITPTTSQRFISGYLAGNKKSTKKPPANKYSTVYPALMLTLGIVTMGMI
jgi:hypothetical protein